MSQTEVSINLIYIFTFISSRPSVCDGTEGVCVSEVTLSSNYVPLVSPLSCVLHWTLLQAQNLLPCRAFYTLAIYRGLVRKERERQKERKTGPGKYYSSTGIFWDDDKVADFFSSLNRMIVCKSCNASPAALWHQCIYTEINCRINAMKLMF